MLTTIFIPSSLFVDKDETYIRRLARRDKQYVLRKNQDRGLAMNGTSGTDGVAR